jgi:Xaa-Pro aminopeptidase
VTSSALRTAPYGRRLANLRAALPQADVDALLITYPPHLRYLVGFDGSMGALIVSADRAVLIVDGRYLTAASAQMAASDGLEAIEVVLADPTYEQTIADVILRGPRVHGLGVEADTMTLSRFDRVSEALGRAEAGAPAGVSAPRLRGTEGIVARLRMIKDAYEIAVLREAARRLSIVARRVLRLVEVGRTERQVAAAIDAALRDGGFDRLAFDTIVASGPNSALPHARPGERVLQSGDSVVLDFGGVYDGYCVDLTRTVQLDPVSEPVGELFAAVRAAQAAAIAAVRPGVAASAVDAAARDVLSARGLGEWFVHGTGHGLGLDVHEEPRIRKAASSHRDEILAPGMVFTIEPGVYVPHVGGVRIEDDVVVVEQGCEVLTDVPIDRSTRGPGDRSPL